MRIFSLIAVAVTSAFIWIGAPMSAANAQGVQKAATSPAPSPIVGEWQGHVPNFGDSKITLTGQLPSGKFAGKMYFSGNLYTFVFGDAVVKDPDVGTAELVGDTLIITAPRGGLYKLKVANSKMEGPFSKGHTYNNNAIVTFVKTK